MIRLLNFSLFGGILVLGTNMIVAAGLWIPDDDFPLFFAKTTHIQPFQAISPRSPAIVRVGTTKDDMTVVGSPSKDSYSVIVEKDLFHPTRKKHIVQKAAPRPLPKNSDQIQAPKPKDQLPRRSPTHPKRDSKKKRSDRLSLQGIVLFGDYQRALIADLLRKPRNPMDVGIGDTVGRYTVKEILEDHVILTAGETETRTLEMMEEDKLNRRSHLVTPTSGTPPSGSRNGKAKKRDQKAKK
ncbi:MAG: hypothetical protein CMH81_05555 [Nitrospiraceae bacterium]|nr:hypothetical protein [Nitrospiraceae bacterium]|tara:strand:+ start:1925 stop:2644 length:720 start_codon:yes stop_codon:yes gene_type:complete